MLKLFKTSFLSLAFLAAGVVSFTACDDSSDGADTDKSTEETKSETKTETETETKTETTSTTTTDGEGSCRFECNPGKDGECGEGKKCYSYGCSADAKQTDATRCGPIVGTKGVNEECSRDSKAGTDNCMPGAFCLPTEGNSVSDGVGTCIAHCDAKAGTDASQLQCEQKLPGENSFCFNHNGGTLPVCLPTCDPLAPSCEAKQACFYHDVSHGFFCTAPAANAASQGGACQNEQECQSGLGCIPKQAFGTTCSADCGGNNAVCGCCAAWCDTTIENPCGPGLTCKVFDEELAENFSKVGICTPA